MPAMQSLIDNLINGNLADAQRQAKRYSEDAIRKALQDLAGFSPAKATLGARYLKGYGRGSWQAYCDAN